MLFTEQANQIFNRAIVDYHVTDHVDTPIHNPYPKESIEYRLYLKCWIDTVQWHFEDLIRDPHINPVNALQLKRRIDKKDGAERLGERNYDHLSADLFQFLPAQFVAYFKGDETERDLRDDFKALLIGLDNSEPVYTECTEAVWPDEYARYKISRDRGQMQMLDHP